MDHIFNIPIIDECLKLKQHDNCLVVSEWDFHENFSIIENFLSETNPVTLIIHCRDAVHPYFTSYDESFSKTVKYFKENPQSKLFHISVNNYHDKYQGLDNVQYHWFPEYHAYYYKLYQDVSICNQPLSKKFLCLNKRVDTTRWILYKKFYTDNLLAQSYFSFLGEDHINGSLNSLSAIAEAERWAKETKTVAPEFDRLQTPLDTYYELENDLSLEKYKKRNFDEPDPTWTINSNLYQTSFCSVIVETSSQTLIPNFSEKTFRALATGHPFILIGAPQSLKFLRDLGFDVYDNIFNNNYDNIDNYHLRLLAIFNEMDRISQYSLDDLAEIRSKILLRRIRNIENYKNLFYKMHEKSNKLIKDLTEFIKL